MNVLGRALARSARSGRKSVSCVSCLGCAAPDLLFEKHIFWLNAFMLQAFEYYMSICNDLNDVLSACTPAIPSCHYDLGLLIQVLPQLQSTRGYAAKDIKFGVECRAGVLAGVDRLADAVQVTLGPKVPCLPLQSPCSQGIESTDFSVHDSSKFM